MRKRPTTLKGLAFVAVMLAGPVLNAQTTGSFNETITFMSASRTLSCYVPPSYNPAVPMKLMIGLHGLGDNSSNYRNALVNSLGFAAAVPNTILVCPDGGSDPNSDFYVPAGDEEIIQASIDFARAGYNIDTTNIILQGFSLGGRSALVYGLGHTDQFKGLLLNTPAIQGVKEAITQFASGGLYDYAQAPQIPIYITHGNTDEVYTTPIDSTYEQLARNDGKQKLVRFNGGHTIPALASIQDFIPFFDQPAVNGHDLQVLAVTVAPQSCNTTVTSKVLVQNKGAEALSSIVLKYQWNGTPLRFTWNGTLPSFAHAEISLPSIITAGGKFTLQVTADTLNGIADTITANNTAAADFRIYTSAVNLPFREKFDNETYVDRWVTVRSGDYLLPWSFDDEIFALATLNTPFLFDNSNRREEFISPLLNLSSLSNPYLAFDVAYNYTHFLTDAIDTILADTLEVLVSTDCGATYQSLFKKAGADLASFHSPILNPTGLASYFIVPADTNWNKVTIDLSSFGTSTDAMVKFRYISGLGSIIYLDNIALENEQTGIAKKVRPQVKIYPNPAKDLVTLEAGDATIESILVSDLSGRAITQVNGKGQKTASVSIQNLPNGIYLFGITTSKGNLNHKVVVQH